MLSAPIHFTPTCPVNADCGVKPGANGTIGLVMPFETP
jgi:hypothetical protein